MSPRFSIIAATITAAVALTGCGPSAKTSTVNIPPVEPAPSEEKGQFVDAPIEGLYFVSKPSGKTGLTDANGNFDYEAGDTVTFYLGGSDGLRIGSASARSVISPFEVTSNFQKAGNWPVLFRVWMTHLMVRSHYQIPSRPLRQR